MWKIKVSRSFKNQEVNLEEKDQIMKEEIMEVAITTGLNRWMCTRGENQLVTCRTRIIGYSERYGNRRLNTKR